LTLAHPEILGFLLLIPFFLIFYRIKYKNINLSFSNSKVIFEVSAKKPILWLLSLIFKVLAVILLIFAAARPAEIKIIDLQNNVSSLDILFSVDISTSMKELLENNKNKTKIAYAAEALKSLLNITEKERTGLVVFAYNAYTILPLSFDKNALKYYAANLPKYPGTITDGTALFDSIAVSLGRLENSTSDSKIIILISDGLSNAGIITPEAVLEDLKKNSVRLYAIQIAQYENYPNYFYPNATPSSSGSYLENVKAVTLQDLCTQTEGKYYSYSDLTSLEDVVKKIESLEKSKVERTDIIEYYEDHFQNLAYIGLLFIALSINIDFLLSKGVKL